MLYIVLFLHQTTTILIVDDFVYRCISYYSYIKPQLIRPSMKPIKVVYRTIPTSNHNLANTWYVAKDVVYRTIPTSNHNCERYRKRSIWLYIVLFLHQTTTKGAFMRDKASCISYYSYIKPQLINLVIMQKISCISYYSYIKPQLLFSARSL